MQGLIAPCGALTQLDFDSEGLVADAHLAAMQTGAGTAAHGSDQRGVVAERGHPI